MTHDIRRKDVGPMDYRTVWQRADDKAAIARLDSIIAPMPVHEACEVGAVILLDRVHADVADAYRRFRERVETA